MSSPLFQDPGQAFLEQGQEHINSPFYDPNRALLERDVTRLQAPGILVNPNEISPDEWAKIPTDGGEYRTLVDVAGGIAMAYALLMVMNQKIIMLRARDFVTEFGSDNLKRQAMKLTGTYRGAWTYMVQPAFGKAMALGSTENLSYAEELEFGRVYAHQIFDYINDTSADALVAAYQNQLAQKWSPQVAWARAAQGYGLDSRGMSQYVKLLQEGEGREIVPSVAKDFVGRALQKRGERIGYNESWRAQELGKTVVWLNQYKQGKLPPDTKREWLTAEDERVCPVCAPMDHVQVPITEQFELPDGNKIWAPGVHPNCRCSVKLSYAEFKHKYTGFSKANFDPNEPRSHGRWTRVGGPEVEEREETPSPQKQAPSPQKAAPSPQKQAPSPQKVAPSPQKLAPSPQKLAPSPQKTVAPSPQKVVAPSPQKVQAPSPTKAEPKLAPARQAEEQRTRFHNPFGPPVTIWANELKWRQGEADPWQHDVDDDTRYAIGNIVDFDKIPADQQGIKAEREAERAEEFKGKTGRTPPKERMSRVSVFAYPMRSVEDMANDASEQYEDQDAWDYFDRVEKSPYMAQSQQFYENAKNQAGMIIPNLNRADLVGIFRTAGDHFSDKLMSTNDLKTQLLNEVQFDGPRRDAYLHYMEVHHPSKVSGGDDLEAYKMNFPRDPHVPTLFLFPRGFQGGYVGRTALIEGRYRVARTMVVPMKLSAGSGSPSNIAAIRYVYLEPIGPGKGDPWDQQPPTDL